MVWACGPAQAPQVSVIGNEELVELLKNPDVQLVDVRTPEEVSYGIIENATIIDFYDPKFEQKIAAFDKEKPIVLYCAAGGRSAQAGQRLAGLGFQEIYDLGVGFRGWKAGGYPIVER